MYQPGKQNAQADVLTRWDKEIKAQEGVKTKYHTKAFLSQDQIDPEVLWDLGIDLENLVAPVEEDNFDEPIGLVDRILRQNQEADSLQALWQEAENSTNTELVLEDGLLLYSGRVVVLVDNDLCTELIKEAHDQISTAHPGRDKTYGLLWPRYYWRGIKPDIERYVRNCHAYRRADAPRDCTPGYLYPLPIPDHPWQHITMDYKSMPADKNGYNMIFVVINWLSKQAISTPCHSTVTAQDMATMFISHIYQYYGAPQTIVSNQGPQFVSQFWKEFCRILGIQLKLLTAFHP